MLGISFLPNLNRRYVKGNLVKNLKAKIGIPEFKLVKKVILILTVIFITTLAQEPAYRYLDSDRPEMPIFPAPSLRMKALGDDFLGIISDLETDVLYFPSLLPFFESNQIRIAFSPDKWDEKGTAGLNLLFPRIFIPQISLGFHNQVRFYSPIPEFYYYDYLRYNYYSDYYSYYKYNNFGVYQQSLFLAFSITQSFSFAPFYNFVTSPYKEERVGFGEYGYDSLDYHKSQYSNKMDNDITENQFGLSLTLKIKENLLNIAASLKNGKNKIDGKNEDHSIDFYAYEHINEYDSSYYYYFHQDSIQQLIRNTEYKTGKGKEKNLKLRWQNERRNKFNLVMDLRKISTDFEGQGVDTSYLNRWSYYFRRWHYPPNPESTETDYDTILEYYQNLSVLSGKIEDLEISLAGGFEFAINKLINTYIGLKSVISFFKDSLYNINDIISGAIIKNDTIRSFVVRKVDAINFSLPMGIEYRIAKPLIIRAGFVSKFSYEKWEFKDEKNEYPISNATSLSFGSTFGLGFKINPRFSFDLYNNGNLFSVGEWLVQARYRF